MKKSLKSVIVKNFIVISVLPSLLLFTFLATSTWHMFLKHAFCDLEKQAQILGTFILQEPEPGERRADFLEKTVKRLSRDLKERITVVNHVNRIIADSNEGRIGQDFKVPGKLENIKDVLISISKNKGPSLINIGSFAGRDIWALPVFDKTKRYVGAVILEYNLDQSGVAYVLKHLFVFWLILLLILLTVAFLYSIYFSVTILSPLKLLKEGALAISKGRWDHKIPVKGEDEVALVAKAFNRMSKRLSSTYRRLKQLNSYISTILDTIGCLVIVVDSSGKIKSVNKKVCEILGFRKVELIGRPLGKLTGDLDFAIEKLKNASPEDKSCYRLENVTFVEKKGEEIPCLVALSCTEYEDEHLLVLSAQDIRPVITLQRKLAEERNRLLVTLRSIGDAVIVTDENGKIVLMNKVAEELTGWTEKESKGRALNEVFKIVNEQTRIPCENPFEIVTRLGKVVGLANHTILIAKDGTERNIADSGAPIRDEDGNIIGVILVFRDVTNERLWQEEIIKKEKLESIGILAGGIAHDFNNILAGILGNLELVSLFIKSEDKVKKYLNLAENAVLRATHLTQQLLTFAKGGEPIKEVASLRDVIIDSAEFVVTGTKIKCDYLIPEDLWSAEIDKGQISQVIQNLVINARHAMPKGGTITITCRNITETEAQNLSLRPFQKYVEIKIQDQGIGIPKNYINRIFEPFFTTKKEGSGLGLSICHSIIAKHGGHMRVKSETGRGTTFFIYIPSSEENQVSKSADTESVMDVKGSGRILIMDDDKGIRQMTRDFLEGMGYEAITVKDGKEAIDRYEKAIRENRPFDVVILDLTIPGGMGGEETVKEILKIDPDAKVIVSSGYANDPIMASYEKHGFKACLKKPYSMKELGKVISEILSQS